MYTKTYKKALVNKSPLFSPLPALLGQSGSVGEFVRN